MPLNVAKAGTILVPAFAFLRDFPGVRGAPLVAFCALDA